MSDLYTELLVKKEKTPKDNLIKAGLIGLIVISLAAGLFINSLLLIIAAGLAVAAYFIIPRTDLEYEYLFVNGDMDIDVIMSRSKRKRVFSLSLSEADIAAPLNSHRLDYYNGNQKLKVYDFSSGNPEHKRFAVIVHQKEETAKVILEPDEELSQLMKNSAPGKVFLD